MKVKRSMTITQALAWVKAREGKVFARRHVTFVTCPSVAWNDPEDRFLEVQVQFHGTHRWCPECMAGCRCLDFVEVLGTEEQGHDEDMSCVWCRETGRAPYEFRLAGAMIGEGL